MQTVHNVESVVEILFTIHFINWSPFSLSPFHFSLFISFFLLFWNAVSWAKSTHWFFFFFSFTFLFCLFFYPDFSLSFSLRNQRAICCQYVQFCFWSHFAYFLPNLIIIFFFIFYFCARCLLFDTFGSSSKIFSYEIFFIQKSLQFVFLFLVFSIFLLLLTCFCSPICDFFLSSFLHETK